MAHELEERQGLLSSTEFGMGREDEGGEEIVVNALHDAPDAVLGDGAVDPVYEAKARVLNKAIQEIGMGRYQWQVRLSFPFNCIRTAYGWILLWNMRRG